MSFCATIWDEMAPARRKILALPFLTARAAGTLLGPTFQHYIVQDFSLIHI